MRMRWISANAAQPHALIERLLRDAHLLVERRVVVAAVVVEIPRREQVRERQRIVVVGTPAVDHEIELAVLLASRAAAGSSADRCGSSSPSMRRRYSCRYSECVIAAGVSSAEQHERREMRRAQALAARARAPRAPRRDRSCTRGGGYSCAKQPVLAFDVRREQRLRRRCSSASSAPCRRARPDRSRAAAHGGSGSSP